eukprot:GGOE01043789.1.p3 GENE.GGOE01043789.1~~GGOE01043789.1.p3  ORF type:complete len:101 (-),score=43.12 GGOE01043789.1:304-561(-)
MSGELLDQVQEKLESEGDLEPRRTSFAVPPKKYLEETVVPTLLIGLSAMVKERPENPIDFLAAFLLRNNPRNPTSPITMAPEDPQ